MGSGSLGPCGQAAQKPVEGARSRGTGFVMVPFSKDRIVLERDNKFVTAMKSDAQVTE